MAEGGFLTMPTASNAGAGLPSSAGLSLRTTIAPIAAKPGWQLKKLSGKHKTIIALHVQNLSRDDIGAVAGCTPEYVSMIVAQPLAQAYLRELEIYTDGRLRQLYGKSVDAIHKGLDSGDDEVALKAARLQLESTGKMKNQGNEAQTAEDVVSALLKHAAAGGVVAIGSNVQVNTGAPT